MATVQRGREFPEAPELSTGAYVPALDGLRCVAVAGVLLSHFAPDLAAYGDWGQMGVRAFFVLSGFLITTLLLRARTAADALQASRPGALREFWIRRIARLWPAYFLCLGASYALGVHGTDTSAWWHALFATNLYVVRYETWPALLSHFWSLAVEQQFYLVWPFVVLWLPRRWLPPILATVVLAAPLFRYVAVRSFGIREDLVGTLLPSCMDFFATGGWVAWYICSRPRPTSKAAARLSVGAGAALLLWLGVCSALKLTGRYPPGFVAFDSSLMALGYAAIIFRLSHGPQALVTRWLSWAPLVFIGRISYGVYLYHNLAQRVSPGVLWRLRGVFEFSSPALQAVWLAGLTILMATLSFYLIEKPVRVWVLRQRRSPAVAATSASLGT